MKILITILLALFCLIVLFLFACCKVASKCDRWEEDENDRKKFNESEEKK